MKKPQFKKSEVHGDLPIKRLKTLDKKGIVVSASSNFKKSLIKKEKGKTSRG